MLLEEVNGFGSHVAYRRFTAERSAAPSVLAYGTCLRIHEYKGKDFVLLRNKFL